MKRCVENRIESCIEKKKTKVLEEHHVEDDETYKYINGRKQVQSSTSALLGCMIGNQQSKLDEFFKEIYQKVPSLYHVSRKDRDTCEVLKMLYFMGWEGVCDMLHKSQSNLEKYTTNAMDLDKGHDGREETATKSDAACSSIDSNTLPLFFRNQEPLQLDEMRNVYGNSPFAAYLDGCSIVNNHADLLSAPLAALCLDIQKSLPHAYINTYLTPPKAAAVSAHADDRDVFVLQVLGEKQWKVYSEVPIPYPSTNEQVGKNGLPIPPHVLEKDPMYDVTLRPGDILYLPRGFVHEASTSTSEPSFHCTVALATHDWSLSTILSKIVQEEISKHSKFRMAIHPAFGRRKDVCSLDEDDNNDNNKTLVEELSNQISDAMECITSKCTVKQVVDILEEKYKSHNDRVEPIRQSLIHDFQTSSSMVAAAAAAATTATATAAVGPTAAKRVGMNSTIRASTPQERSMAPLPVATHGRGLTVREEICDGLLYLLDMLKKNETRIVRVSQLRDYYYLTEDHLDQCDNKMICDLSMLSFVKCCVELGALALID